MVKLNAPTKSPEEIAKKWKLPLDKVKNQIKKGAKVEKEHTKSPKAAKEVARDHLGERPDYYKKLDKMEKTKIEKLDEVSKDRLAKYVSKIAKMPSFSREGEYYYKNEKFGALATAKIIGRKNSILRPRISATEETEMELNEINKNKIEEAIRSLVQGNYNEMKEKLNESLQEKVIDSLEEKKKIIASQYFGQ